MFNRHFLGPYSKCQRALQVILEFSNTFTEIFTKFYVGNFNHTPFFVFKWIRMFFFSNGFIYLKTIQALNWTKPRKHLRILSVHLFWENKSNTYYRSISKYNRFPHKPQRKSLRITQPNVITHFCNCF